MDPNTLMMVVLIVLVGGMLYLSSRTRKKQQAAQQQKMSAIRPGVRVTTIAGLQGTVSAVADDTIELEIAPGVRTTWLRASVRDVLDPAVPQADDDALDSQLDETLDDTEHYESSLRDDTTKKDLG